MSKWFKSIFAVLMVVGMAGCVSTDDIDVESVTNEKVNLDGYKTYQFMEESGVIEVDGKGKVRESDKKIAALIEEIINTELQKMGKKPVSKSPDFLVAYVGGSNEEAVKVKLDEKGKQVVEKAPEAALLIMLIDAETGAILRLSTAEGEVKQLPEAQKRERIEFAVKKMLKGM